MSDGAIDNPFASPQIAAEALDPAMTNLSRTRPWAMLFVGIVVGAIIGATAGGVTSGTIGFVGIAIQQAIYPDDDGLQVTAFSPWAALLLGGLIGGFQGAWMGGVIGGIVGLVCGTATPLPKKLPKWVGGAMSAVGGGFFGAVAGHTVFIGPNTHLDFGGPKSLYQHIAAVVSGGLLGIAAGILAGAFMGRVLYGMAVRRRSVGLPGAFGEVSVGMPD